MPEVSADQLTYTLRVKPGIYFAADTVFNNKKRELTAEDYVYTIKRHFDPKVNSKHIGEFEGLFVGMDENADRIPPWRDIQLRPRGGGAEEP